MPKARGNMNTPSINDDSRDSKAKPRKTRVKQSDVPRHSLHEALRIAQAISDDYAKKPTKPMNVALALEVSPGSSNFKMLLGASSAYGLTEGTHDTELISITELGLRIIAPTVEDMEATAMREAILNPRVVKEFLMRYKNSKFRVKE